MSKKIKDKEVKDRLVEDIKESMKDPEIRKGIKQFIKATSC